MLLTSSPPIRRLLIALVLITQVPAVLMMGSLEFVEYQRQREAVTDHMVERSRVLAVELRERLDKAQSVLEQLAAQVPDDEAGLAEFRTKALAALPGAGIDAIALVAPTGYQVMNTRALPGTPLPRAAPAAMAVFSTGKRSVIQLTTGGLTGQPIAVIGLPVVRDSRIRYALTAGIEPARFLELLQRQNLPADWLAAVIDSQGLLVARVPGQERFLGHRVTADLYDRIKAAGRGEGPMTTVFEGRTLEGVDVVISMRRSPVTDWTVVVSVPRSGLIAPVWRSAARLGILLLILVAASMTAALLISRRIVSSIERLRDAAAALPSGKPFQLAGIGFAEGQQLGKTLEDARRQVEAVRAEIERVSQGFHHALMREVETRQHQTARELHDSVGSSLAGVSLLLGNACAAAKEPRLELLLHKALEQVRRSAQEVREISRGMTPAGSEAGALLPAIEQFAFELTQFNGVHCTVNSRGDFSKVSSETGTHLYRIVQEAANNAIRHGGATALRITLAECCGRCRLAIRDNGSGCDFGALPESHHGLGLRSMQARARAIDGRLDIGNMRSGGCRVRVSWSTDAREPTVALAQLARANAA